MKMYSLVLALAEIFGNLPLDHKDLLLTAIDLSS